MTPTLVLFAAGTADPADVLRNLSAGRFVGTPGQPPVRIYDSPAAAVDDVAAYLRPRPMSLVRFGLAAEEPPARADANEPPARPDASEHRDRADADEVRSRADADALATRADASKLPARADADGVDSRADAGELPGRADADEVGRRADAGGGPAVELARRLAMEAAPRGLWVSVLVHELLADGAVAMEAAGSGYRIRL